MGFTPLHVAAAFSYLDIAKLLIEYGADINSRDNDGRFVALVKYVWFITKKKETSMITMFT